jgi:hypothetical protein
VRCTIDSDFDLEEDSVQDSNGDTPLEAACEIIVSVAFNSDTDDVRRCVNKFKYHIIRG